MIEEIKYYFWSSFRRKLLDELQEKYKSIYKGTVLDIGGRDRGKFKKPKDKVEKWIFADICADHEPDIVLDASDMHMIQNESIDVIAAMEVFAHVEKAEKALDECLRVLKKDGVFVFSALFLYPIINDPTDYQRWTEAKWKQELSTRGFKVETIEPMGRYFTVMADFMSLALQSKGFFRCFRYFLYPLFSLAVKLDNTKFVTNSQKLNSFTTGYFFIARK